MNLINQSVAPAKVFVSQVDAETRVGTLVLKATFETDGAGSVQLAHDRPLPLFEAAEPTRLGDLPSDLVLRPGSGVDLIVLGVAHAAGGAPVSSMRVALGVGEKQRDLLVTGDRVWIGEGDEAQISHPVAFTRMPLRWDRAFGGGGDVWLDPQTRLPIGHPANREGRGFDLAGQAKRTAAGLGCAGGFPIYEAERSLPNIEDPRAPIARWTDDPIPYGWGVESPAIAAFRALRQALDTGALEEEARARAASAPPRSVHPDLQFPRFAPGTPIALHGVRSTGAWWFAWPPFQPRADYVVGSRTGTLELVPVQVVLLPEENRFTATYRHQFRLGPHDTADERSLRIRLE